MSRPRLPALPCALLLLAVAGCSSNTPNLDSQFGLAVSQLNAQQVLHPDAGLNADPVAGMDGKAASGAQQRYQKSFAAPEPQNNVFSIGVGTR